MGLVVIVHQRCDTRVDPERDVSPAAAVASVGSAERLELFAVNRRDPVSAPTRAEMQDDAVHKRRDSHRFQPLSLRKRRWG
jgi:hypothetical protein